MTQWSTLSTPDPRMPNARQVSVDLNGKFTGVDLAWLANPTSRFELVRAELIDENAAQGQTVARVFVKDINGLDLQVAVWLVYPWAGWVPGNSFENRLLPGNTNYPYQHIITNKYNPSGRGPLAICIGGPGGLVDSDVIGGVGLPDGHHVSFQLVFRERGPVMDVPDPPGEPGDMAQWMARIEAKIDRIGAHFAD